MLDSDYIGLNLIRYRDNLYKCYGIDPAKIIFVPALHIYEKPKVELWFGWTINDKNMKYRSHVPTNIKAPHIFRDREVIVKIMV